jgi:hypothetical protein
MQFFSDPDIGEHFTRLLVLGHAKLDATEASRFARGGTITLGGGLGGLAGLMNMTFEELVGAMVGGTVDR